MKVNRMKWAKVKLQWEGKLRAAASFKGIKDYEEWAMGLGHQIPLENPFDEFVRGAGEGLFEEFTPEEFFKAHEPVPSTEKGKLFAQAKELRKQIDDAIAVEDYEKADILQKTLNVIEIKYNKL